MVVCPSCQEPLSELDQSKGVCPRCGASLDSVRPSKPGTVGEREIQATIVIDSDAAAEPTGNSTKADIGQTLESGSFDAGSSQNPGTVPDVAYKPTIESDGIPSDLATHIGHTWAGVEQAGASPDVTIKGLTEGGDGESTLVVQPRALRKSNDRTTVNADYELLDKLGEGGMGFVYLARQASINRIVALKMLKGDTSRNQEQRFKFLSEAVVTGDLDHPNIVPIYDLGTSQDGALFYSMKRVLGTPWIDLIRRKSLRENIEILMKVADAVAFAHSRGVIHRDLKPENVMLGDFGEVLLLDWGLAMPTAGFEKSQSITRSCAMGGTPAYMAPEMATGPARLVTTAADVYLLGAILFEVVAGCPPHAGRGVLECLTAAAANKIQPTDKTGELLDIALKAMSTQPADRYASVREFQDAIRTYLSHTESIALSTRAEQELDKARASDDYQDYARSLFAFDEAHALWGGNDRASRGRSRAALSYAQSALRKDDLDLAASLLSESDPSHVELLSQIRIAQRDRDMRQQRLKRLRRAVMAGVVLFILVVTGASIWIWHERNNALAAERLAQTQRKIAERRKQQADLAKEQEASARKTAEQEKKKADIARDQAVQAQEVAVAEREKAVAAKNEADQQRELAEYQAYIALIGLAAAKIDENAFGTARQLLDQCPSRLRHWEWRRLMYMCRLSVRDYATGSPVESLATAPDGSLLTGGWNGLARLWDSNTGAMKCEFAQGDLNFAFACAISPDGHRAAIGTSDRDACLSLWDIATGKRVRKLEGHSDSVVSVTFSQDGRSLLSGSFDRTARLWDVETGRSLRVMQGHRGWVWSVAFCRRFDPATNQPLVENRAVTASQDGFAYVWQLDVAPGTAEERSPPFRGHSGPIYAAAFSPDGTRIATAGYDKRVLLWKPSDLREFEYENVIFNETLSAGRQSERRPVAPPQFVAMEGHAAAVHCVAFDKSGKRLVSGGHDNTVRIWDCETGKPLKILRGHDSWVRACLFADDGGSVLSAGYDQQVKRWNVESYEEVRRIPRARVLEGHAGDVLGAQFSPDGKMILTAGRDRSARTWDAIDGRELMRFEEGHSFLASRVRFFADGKWMATAAVDNTARVWDVTTGTELVRIDGTGRQAALAVSPSGNWVLTGSVTHAARLWEIVEARQDNGQIVHRAELRRELKGHTAPVSAAVFSPDGRLLYTGDAGGLGLLWDVAEKPNVRELHKLRGHSARITEATFLPDQQRLLTASGDGTVGQWTVATGEERRDLVLRHKPGSAVTGLALSRDGAEALTSCEDGLVRIWNVSRAELARQLNAEPPSVPSPGKLSPVVAGVAISPDGQWAATICPDDQSVRLWDFPSGKEVHGAKDPQRAPYLDFRRRGLAWSATFSPDSVQIVTVGGDCARLWNVSRDASPERESQVFVPHGSIASANFSPDGSHIVTGSWDDSARIWNVATGKAERKLEGHQGAVNSAAYSPDGQFVLTASSDATAILWDARTGTALHTFRGHEGEIQSAAFSPDGKHIVTASHDATARIWSATARELESTLQGHNFGVLCAQFSPDGRRVVTGGEDNTAILWDWERGAPLLRLSGHTAAVSSVAFSPDGARVLTGSGDFTAKLWDVNDVREPEQAESAKAAVAPAKEILTLKGHDQPVTSVSFSLDGVFALTGSRDGTAVIWLAEKPSAPAEVASHLPSP